MKKILLIVLPLIFLVSCSIQKKFTNNFNLPAISTGYNTGIFVAVSDPHFYSKMGPKIISGSYYFNPMSFYKPVKNISFFLNSYFIDWNKKEVYYYDENGGAQAGLVVYILRNYFHKKNVSLLLSDELQGLLKYHQKLYTIPKNLGNLILPMTGGYIGIGKYKIVYNPNEINFETGDLLLYSSDLLNMKEDNFYKKYKGKINIKDFNWSKLMNINKGLKSFSTIKRLLSGYNLNNYETVYIYYPKYRYRSGVLALYLQQYHK